MARLSCLDLMNAHSLTFAEATLLRALADRATLDYIAHDRDFPSGSLVLATERGGALRLPLAALNGCETRGFVTVRTNAVLLTARGSALFTPEREREVASRGPWIITDEGRPVVKREQFDADGNHLAWELLDGDTDGLTAPLAALREVLRVHDGGAARNGDGENEAPRWSDARVAIAKATGETW